MAEFTEAAFPWIVMGLFVAVCCVLMNRKKNPEEELEKNGKNEDDR